MLPTLTTVDWHYSRAKQRWLTAVEKLAAMGFPATLQVAQAYKSDTLLLFLGDVAIQTTHGLHKGSDQRTDSVPRLLKCNYQGSDGHKRLAISAYKMWQQPTSSAGCPWLQLDRYFQRSNNFRNILINMEVVRELQLCLCLLPSKGMILLAALGSIELLGEQLPTLRNSTVVKVPPDGRCFWACLFLGCASKRAVWFWHRRPRSSLGYASAADGKAEAEKVLLWAMDLGRVCNRMMPRATRGRLRDGKSAEHEDIEP